MPTLQNLSPASGAAGVSPTAILVFQVASGADVTAVDAYVEGAIALTGGVFAPPYDGPLSSITPVIIGGFDGYDVSIDNTGLFPGGFVNIRVLAADAGGAALDGTWSFLVGSQYNALYFSDGYALKRIHVKDVVGECQMRTLDIISSLTIPTMPSDNVFSISGTNIGGSLYLAASTDDGVAVMKNETGSLRTHSDGYDTDKAQINASGTMYLLNRTLNRVDVYYGADYRAGSRPPDFTYSSTSTPPIMDGYVTALQVVSGGSTVLSGGTRLYVGTTHGLTRIDAYDLEIPDGYSAGLDAYGQSFTYGISSSSATYKVIGGADARVEAVDSDESIGMILVATGDGLSQISLTGNRLILFMTQAGGFLPSNAIKDISGKQL